ncbi:MAG: hypothetical protein IKW32_08225, partial [Bacteroidaceae bacterium]|nr:hypothetical protein [Bacteroidaceae bacterium]
IFQRTLLYSFLFESGCKGKGYFELPKLFEVFFEKFFFKSVRFKACPLFQYFNSSAFLSRKRVQNYCFITYTPNVYAIFLVLFGHFVLKWLIIKYAIEHKKRGDSPTANHLSP